MEGANPTKEFMTPAEKLLTAKEGIGLKRPGKPKPRACKASEREQ